MPCDNCGADDPVVKLTRIENDEMRTLHLCRSCAAEKGVEGEAEYDGGPLAEFLAKMGGGFEPSSEKAEGAPSASGSVGCEFCGLTLRQFRDSGRLGCPHCWTAFESHLRGLLRRLQGSHQHAGKVYLSPDPTTPQRRKRLEGLKRKLERAIELEDFERAADLRDQIRELEPTNS
ncbi:MAG: hypothetical protein EA352_04455 [Gemmatimonadales bacterium]|nr:MAG: hypothetical protein EA352_04455 [Gemmatimonadales bacterium]